MCPVRHPLQKKDYLPCDFKRGVGHCLPSTEENEEENPQGQFGRARGGGGGVTAARYSCSYWKNPHNKMRIEK